MAMVTLEWVRDQLINGKRVGNCYVRYCIYIYICIYLCMCGSDVNDAELLMPSRDFWFLMILSFLEKKTSPGRSETLAKRAQSKSRL